MLIRSLRKGRINGKSRHRASHNRFGRTRPLRHEPLEDRQLLSTTPGWMFSIGGPSNDVYEESHSIAVGAAGDVYVSGRFGGTVDFDPSPEGVYELTALDDDPYSDGNDNFIAKYSSTGEFRWAHSQGGFGYEPSSHVALDAAENVYFVGYQEGEAYLDGSPMVDRQGKPVDLGAGYGTVFAKFDSGGNFQWAQQLRGDAATDDEVRGINIAVYDPDTPETPSPDVYLVGAFDGTVDFDPSNLTNTLSSVGDSGYDMFVAKYDTEGNYLWARRAGGDGSASDGATAVAVDAAGNACVVGYFSGTGDFGNTTLTSKGTRWDSFVTKLAPNNGEFLWATRMGGDSQENDQDLAMSVAVSSNGTLYVGSRFYGTADYGSTTLVSHGEADGAVSKLDDTGQFLWTKQFGAEEFDQVSRLSVDDGGNVHAAGNFSTSLDFDPGIGSALLTSKEGHQNVFVVKLDANGDFISVRRMGGNGEVSSDYARGIQVFGDDIYTTGEFLGVGDFDTGTETVIQSSSYRDIFVVKTTQDRGAIFGRVFVDSDQDGVFDDGESALEDRTVYLDQNQNGSLDAGEIATTTGPAGEYVLQHLLADTSYHLAQVLPAGWEETAAPDPVTLAAGEFRTDQDFGTYTSADVTVYSQTTPETLNDANPRKNGVTTSTIDVSNSGTILDLNVTLDITHTYDGQLTANLIAPNGTSVELFSKVGGSGDNFTGTVLDDQATTSITAGTAPFTGTFQPEGSLAAFNDLDVAGTWTLEIVDDTISDGNGGTDTAIVTLTVDPVADPPDAVDDTESTTVETAVTIDVLANDSDPDGDSLSVTGVTDPGNGTAVLNADDTITYTPDSAFVGTDSFTYTISDGNEGTDTATVTIDVSEAVSGTALYVYDIDFASKAGGKFRQAVFVIRSDSDGDGQGTSEDAAVAGGEITVEFAGVTYTGTTDSNGVFRTDFIKDLSSGDHYAEVVDLVLADHYWDPMVMDLEDDSDGDGLPDAILPP